MRARRAKKQKKATTGPSKTVAWMNLGVLVCIVTVGVSHVVHMAGATQHGYAMRELETQIEELAYEAERVEARIVEATSLDMVTDRMQILGFVESDEIVYLDSVGSVAKR